jgi:hypothetical protein
MLQLTYLVYMKQKQTYLTYHLFKIKNIIELDFMLLVRTKEICREYYIIICFTEWEGHFTNIYETVARNRNLMEYRK